MLGEIREQPGRCCGCSSWRRVRGRGGARTPSAPVVRLVGHGTSDNAASYGIYAFGLLPGWTALRDSISLTVYYGATLDLPAPSSSRSRNRARPRTSSSTSSALGRGGR